MGGKAHDRLRTEDRAGDVRRHVVLPDVDAIGAAGKGEVGPVVQDERHCVFPAHLARQRGSAEQGSSVELFLVP